MDGPRRLESTDTIRGHEKTPIFVYFVYFVVPTLRRAQAPRMASLHLPEAARDHRDPACSRSRAQRWWNHETHEIREGRALKPKARDATDPCWASGWKPLPPSLGLHGMWQWRPAAGRNPARAETARPRFRRARAPGLQPGPAHSKLNRGVRSRMDLGGPHGLDGTAILPA